MEQAIQSRPSVARASLLLVVLVLGCWLAVCLLARGQPLIDWFHERQVAHWQRSDEVVPQVPFLYRSDRLFFDLIPKTDHTRGGVYAFGASNLATALIPWNLESPERELVHNYSVGGISYESLLHLFRYLIEYESWPARDGKTLVVITTFWGNAKRMSWLPYAFPYGMYDFSDEAGLHPSGMPALQKLLIRERVRARAFLRTLTRIRIVGGGLDLQPQRGVPPMTKAQFLRRWTSRMGPDWREDMQTEIEALGEAIDLLTEHDARVAVVLLPTGSWSRELPYHGPFVARMTALCESKSVPLTDLTHALDESDFVALDNLHENYRGTLKVHELIMQIARDHLRRIGAL